MTKKIVEITLTPISRFFFGQDIVFGGGLGEDERRRSYLVHSGNLPQQTTILGAIREAILRQHDALLPAAANSEQKRRAVQLVGEGSFSVGTDGKSYGVIRRLSPLVISDDDGDRWQPQPLDDQYGKDKTSSLCWEISLDKGEIPSFYLKNYDAKAGLTPIFSNGVSHQKMDDFFREQSRVGVRVTNRKEHRWRSGEKDVNDGSEGFYRQTFRANRNSAYATAARKKAAGSKYSLVFRAELDGGEIEGWNGLQDDTITMGGERSTFKMTVKEVNKLGNIIRPVNYQKNTQPLPNGFGRIVLLSDAFVDLSFLEQQQCFVVGQAKTFRYFSTELKVTNNFFYLAYDKKAKAYNKAGRSQSCKFTLLEKGSVIIARSGENTAIQTAPATAPKNDLVPVVPSTPAEASAIDAVTAHLEAQVNFRTIGYNQFQNLTISKP